MAARRQDRGHPAKGSERLSVARGSIRRRELTSGDVVYDVTFDVPDPTGRRRQRRRTLPTRRAAERFLASQLAAVDRGEIRAESGETLASYAERILPVAREQLAALPLKTKIGRIFRAEAGRILLAQQCAYVRLHRGFERAKPVEYEM